MTQMLLRRKKQVLDINNSANVHFQTTIVNRTKIDVIMYKNAFFCNNNNVLGIFPSLASEEDEKNSLYVSVQYFFMILPVTTHPHGKGVSPHNTLLLRKKIPKLFPRLR